MFKADQRKLSSAGPTALCGTSAPWCVVPEDSTTLGISGRLHLLILPPSWQHVFSCRLTGHWPLCPWPWVQNSAVPDLLASFIARFGFAAVVGKVLFIKFFFDGLFNGFYFVRIMILVLTVYILWVKNLPFKQLDPSAHQFLKGIASTNTRNIEISPTYECEYSDMCSTKTRLLDLVYNPGFAKLSRW